ncbi:MAG: Gfo/Idh/MocA family oxidoreductase [Armatimonadetes bacterium]|nr:Gfo/Idh/MocA family oxidoreductase [Armatimonadota bacterium]
MRSIRIAMVGAGFAADFHCEAYRQVKGLDCPVVAVTSTRAESREAFARKHGIPGVYASLEELLDRAEVDVVDVCAPTNVHGPAAVLAAQAGKHVIVEKPLTGYTQELWGGVPPPTPSLQGGGTANGIPLLGNFVERRVMLDAVMAQCDEIERALATSGVKFCYAENWVYAPAVQKARRLIQSGGGAVLRLLAEESHSGSHAAYAKYWALAGGGSLLRTGSHPIGGVCYIKQAEGLARNGQPIRPKSVMAETAFLTKMESYLAAPQRYCGTELADCEDWGAAYITFEDGSVADVCSSDVVLGGVYNHMQVFLSNGRIECNMNPMDAVMAYGPAEDSFGDEYLAEKISTRLGWNYASPDEAWASGYPQEIQDFMEAIAQDHEPLSGWTLARDVTAVIFAAYVSAWEGRRVDVPG